MQRQLHRGALQQVDIHVILGTLYVIAALRKRTCYYYKNLLQPMEYVIKDGERADCMFVIQRGVVASEGRILLAGKVFGTLAEESLI